MANVVTPWAEVWRCANPVRRVRLRRGLSRAKLAEKSGRTRQCVWCCETGSHPTNVPTLADFALVLRVPLHALAQAYIAWWELRPTHVRGRFAHGRHKYVEGSLPTEDEAAQLRADAERAFDTIKGEYLYDSELGSGSDERPSWYVEKDSEGTKD